MAYPRIAHENVFLILCSHSNIYQYIQSLKAKENKNENKKLKYSSYEKNRI